MDSRNNFLDSLNEFINTIDEGYLIGAANKGIVNRAKKDLDKAENITYEILDDRAEFKIDDIECSIYDNINIYKCSCPSRSICKHIIMAYLYMKNNSQTSDEGSIKEDDDFSQVVGKAEDDLKVQAEKEDSRGVDNAQFSPPVEKGNPPKSADSQEVKNVNSKEFKNIKELSIASIKKSVGEKNLFTIIKRIEFGINYEIRESSLITVEFKDEGISVKLLDDLDNSVCSCKEKNMCIHKAEAIILYKLQKGYLTMEELKSYDKSFTITDEEELKKACREIKNVMEEILINGLSRLSSNILDRLNNSAVICHNYEMPNFEKNLRNIREEINLYLRKDASFVPSRLLGKISRLYMNAVRIERADDIKKYEHIIGEFKSSYYKIPPIELYGLGVENWSTKSGYEGITYYFYENQRKKFFTFNKSAAVFYDNHTARNYLNGGSNVPWNINCNSEELSHVHLKLLGGKININRRISSSSESKAFVIDETDIRNLSLEDYTYDKWRNIIDLLKIKRNNEENYNLIIINAKSFAESSYDSINQLFKAELHDAEDKIMHIEIPFSLRTKKMIKTLEKITAKDGSAVFLGRVYLQDGQLMFYPITYFEDEQIINLT